MAGLRRNVFSGVLLPVLAGMVCVAVPRPVHAEIHRCTNPGGDSVYTDKRCEDIGAFDRLPRASTNSASASRLYRNTCSRTLRDLVYELTSAIDGKDVNRLAGIYDWSGMSTSNAYRVMDQLSAIAERPLVDVMPVVPRAVEEDGVIVDGEYYPQDAVRRAPTGLRLEQTLGRTATPSRTILGLRRYLGCWWVRL